MFWFPLFIALQWAGNGDEVSVAYNENQPLTWEFFQAQPRGSNRVMAVTTSGLYMETIAINQEQKYVDILVEARFYPKKSWRRISADNYILAHEQGHFDISEIYARQLRKALLNSSMKASNFNKAVTKMKYSFDAKGSKYQKSYDRRTVHSTNRHQQKVWDLKINNALNKYGAFKKNMVRVYLR